MRLRLFARDSSGATAVEFALILLPLCLLLVGGIEVARLVWTQHALNKTAISAARCIGIRNASCSRDGAYVRDLAVTFVRNEARSWMLGLEESDIAITDAADCDGSPGFSKVALTLDYISAVPLIAKGFAGTSDHLVARACYPTQPAT